MTNVEYAKIQSSHQYKWSTLIKISASYATRKSSKSHLDAININLLIFMQKLPNETDYNEPGKKQPTLENFVDKRRLNKN
jgi:hypothetical protein